MSEEQKVVKRTLYQCDNNILKFSTPEGDNETIMLKVSPISHKRELSNIIFRTNQFILDHLDDDIYVETLEYIFKKIDNPKTNIYGITDIVISKLFKKKIWSKAMDMALKYGMNYNIYAANMLILLTYPVFYRLVDCDRFTKDELTIFNSGIVRKAYGIYNISILDVVYKIAIVTSPQLRYEFDKEMTVDAFDVYMADNLYKTGFKFVLGKGKESIFLKLVIKNNLAYANYTPHYDTDISKIDMLNGLALSKYQAKTKFIVSNIGTVKRFNTTHFWHDEVKIEADTIAELTDGLLFIDKDRDSYFIKRLTEKHRFLVHIHDNEFYITQKEF